MNGSWGNQSCILTKWWMAFKWLKWERDQRWKRWRWVHPVRICRGKVRLEVFFSNGPIQKKHPRILETQKIIANTGNRRTNMCLNQQKNPRLLLSRSPTKQQIPSGKLTYSNGKPPIFTRKYILQSVISHVPLLIYQRCKPGKMCWDSKNTGFSPQMIHFNRVFPLFSPSILGVFPLFLETPTMYVWGPQELEAALPSKELPVKRISMALHQVRPLP